MSDTENPFTFLEHIAPAEVAGILSTELAFVQGAALCMMPPAMSAKIMASMDEDVRRDVAAAMGKSRQMPRDVLVDIADELRKKCPAPQPKPQKTLGESIANLQDLIKGAKSKSSNPPENVAARIIPPEQARDHIRAQSTPAAAPIASAAPIAPAAPTSPTAHHPQAGGNDHSLASGGDAKDQKRQSAMQKMLEQAQSKRSALKPTAAGTIEASTRKLKPGAHKIDGMALAAHILREADVSVRNNVMHEMPELYNKLHDQMFDFADLEHSDAMTLGKIFTNVDLKVAAMALRFSSENLQKRVYESISKNRAQMIMEEIKATSSEQIRLSAIDEAQQAVIEFAVTLQNKGQIIIDPDAPDLV